MFSSFGQPTRSGGAPAVNPFAPTAATATPVSGFGTNPFGSGSAGDSKNDTKQAANPFGQNNNAGLSDGGNKSSKGKRGRNDATDKRPKTRDAQNGPSHIQGFGFQNGTFQNQASDGQGSRATSPSSASSGNEANEPVAPRISTDPLAKKIYERLRQDGISPPSWPSQPGNPKSKAAMSKFRDQYEAYRKRARTSLTKAGLIDDPDKRKALSDAIEFKGICEDMCPEFEKITRITEIDVNYPEKDPRTTFPNTGRMVKKLARSAAGQEAPLPMDVRSVPALRRTLDYLLDDLLRNDGNLPVVHGFLWDRTRAIRRDFSFFSTLTPDEIKTQVYVLENIARFHVTSLHLLSQDGKAPEDFVEQQELEQLGKALLSLRDVYDDCGLQGIKCENEAEFRAYYLLFHARDPSILETLQRQWKPNLWQDSDDVRTAVSLVEALQNSTDFHGPLKDGPSLAAPGPSQAYFRIVKDPKVSYTMACFAECHLPQLRRSILQTVKRALARPKDPAKDVNAETLNRFLQFDTVQQAVSFSELHGLQFVPDPDSPTDQNRQILILDSRGPLPHRRLQHQFSQTLVERKRGSRTLPDIIHHTVFEDPKASFAVNGLAAEGSLFVEDANAQQASQPMSGGFSSATGLGPGSASPFNSSPFAPSTSSRLTSGTMPDASAASNAQAPTALGTPFANTTAASDGNRGTANPFASSSSPLPSFFSGAKTGQTDNAVNAGGQTEPAKTNPFSAISQPGTAKAGAGDNSVSSSPFASKPATGFGFPSQPSSSESGTQGKGFFPSGSQTDIKPPPPASTAGSMPPPPIPSQKPLPEKPGMFSPPPTSPFKSSSPSVSQDQPPNTSILGSTPPSGQDTTQKHSDLPGQGNSGFMKLPNFAGSAGIAKPSSATQSSPGISPLTTEKPSFFSSSQPATAAGDAPITGATALSGLGDGIKQAPSPAEVSVAPTPAAPIKPVAPTTPRDLMADFTKWFVLGDNGILEQFQMYIIDELIQGTYEKYEKEVEEKRLKEEEERIDEEVRRFRTYNLSLRYFYRWKQNAREKRLSVLRRSGREQLRAFYASQHAASRQAKKEAATKAAKQRADLANVNRPEEFMDMLKRKNVSRHEAREAILSSGVLSGMANEAAVVDSIVRQEFRSRSNSVASSYQSQESSPTASGRSGSKTKALRDMYLGKPGRFRRSLPSISSRDSEPPETSGNSTRPTSNASARWRLKAMGIVQLPDGTAVPESMARDMLARPSHYSSLGFASSYQGNSVRRASSVSGGSHTFGSSPIRRMAIPTVDDGSATNKRKRSSDDEDDVEVMAMKEDTAERSKHKRIMSEAEKLTSELKAIRQELEEGREWFKSQNERLRSESRAETPLYDESM